MKKVQTTAIILVNIEVSHIVFVRFNVPNDIPVVFHYDPNYNYHLIIKESAKEFERKFECLVENTEKYNIFPFQQKKKFKKLIKRVAKVQ